MKRRPVVLRDAARRDVDEAVSFYLDQGATDAAARFVDALQRALEHIGEYPETGSPRYAHELDLPGVRYWPVAGFPYLIFFVERTDQVDVWRVLHGDSDVPAWMRG